jgi:hypothetical protein
VNRSSIAVVRRVMSPDIDLIVPRRNCSFHPEYAFIILIMSPTGSGCWELPSVDVNTVLMVSFSILNPSNCTHARIAARRNWVTMFVRSIDGRRLFAWTILAITILRSALIAHID